MQLYLTGKHLKVVPRLREHIEKHLDKLSHYDAGIISAHVVLKVEKYINTAEVTVKSSHFEFYGEGRADDNMFSAIDLAIHRVESQLKKHREKLKALRKHTSRATSAVAKRILSATPSVVSSQAYAPDSLTEEVASTQLNLSDEDFLIFRNVKSKKINVIYKREDGHHGLVQPGA